METFRLRFPFLFSASRFHSERFSYCQRFNWISCNTLFQCLFASCSFLVDSAFRLLNFISILISSLLVGRFCLSTTTTLRVQPLSKVNWAKLSARPQKLIEMWEKRFEVNCKVNFCLTLVFLRMRSSDFDKKSLKHFEAQRERFRIPNRRQLNSQRWDRALEIRIN